MDGEHQLTAKELEEIYKTNPKSAIFTSIDPSEFIIVGYDSSVTDRDKKGNTC